jgi:hypothetical protein
MVSSIGAKVGAPDGLGVGLSAGTGDETAATKTAAPRAIASESCKPISTSHSSAQKAEPVEKRPHGTV